MPDRKLEYWYDWSICGPDGKEMLRLRKSPSPLDKKRLNDIGYLCDRIKDYPEATLMNPDFWYTITMLRQKAFKNGSAAKDLKLVCKAIQGDGRKQKDQEYFDGLRTKIKNDIDFFKTVIERIEKNERQIADAIFDYLTAGAKTVEETDGRAKLTEYYENVFYEYRKIYKKLIHIMTPNEIFCFLNHAAENIHLPNVSVSDYPDGRRLEFVKLKTWYVKGPDIRVIVSEQS